MTGAPGNVLVLGIGNVLMGDDGVGVHVVRQLAGTGPPLPEDVQVVDGGTLGLDLLPAIADARALLVVDAVDLGGDPGQLRVFRRQEVHGALSHHLSAHQVGLADLLAVGRLTESLPEDVTLVGIQPGRIDVNLELSDECRAVVPRAVAALRAEIEIMTASPDGLRVAAAGA